MKRRTLVAGGVALAVVGVVAAIALRRPPAPAPVAAAAPELELAPADVAVAAPRELRRTLEVTGALKAVDWAMVKARVAAEVARIDVREGDRVSAGQVLGRLDGTEYELKLRQAQQQAMSAKAQLDIAERALENNRALVGQGFISQNALDTSISNAAAARAALQAANAAADLARKALTDTVLRAPIAGWVAQRLAQPGERVAVDARLIEIVDLSKLEIEAAVPAQDLASLKPGAQATLRVEGVEAPVTARVARIGPSAQAGTRAVPIYLAVDGQPGLRQGLFAQGEIELERRTALAVPASAVRIDQALPYAIALEEGRAVARPLALGLRSSAAAGGEALVEVTAGLAEGSTVLRGSVGTVRDGT
ncbi:MAG TPA: efflux RND transporter periplasmic adaptor subunit, partial [Methylibium sp.]|nr:efflux RND transporter periplasmic adaptor subunit [Methylibium sp.]